MIKLILTDMDGTLLDTNGKLPPDFAEVFALLQEKNIYFGAASGRQYAGLIDTFTDYKDNMLFLAENGSVININGQMTVTSEISKADALNIINKASHISDVDFMINCPEYAYIFSHEPRFVAETNRYCAKVRTITSFDEIEEKIVKLAFFSKSGKADKLFPRFKNFNTKLKIILSSFDWIDIMTPEINKGIGVSYIQQQLNITPAETVVFGDYLNDLEMMSAAHYSYAMANAHPILKRAARRVLEKTNGEYGVTAEIKSLLSEKKQSK